MLVSSTLHGLYSSASSFGRWLSRSPMGRDVYEQLCVVSGRRFKEVTNRSLKSYQGHEAEMEINFWNMFIHAQTGVAYKLFLKK